MSQQVRIPIYTLAGGVGRQPVSKRLPSEAQELNNVLLTIENSFEKRNGFEYVPGKTEDYVEDVNLAPNAMVFNTLDLTEGGGEGTETYIPDDEDDFFFNWTTIDEDNVFLIGINVSLTQRQPTTVTTTSGDISNTTQVKGSSQDYVWSDAQNKYLDGYSTNFRKKFITVWKLVNNTLFIQDVDYPTVTSDVIDYLKEGYVAGKGNESLKLRSFGTSTIVLNNKVKAGLKELYKTDFNGNPINTTEFQESGTDEILIRPKFKNTGVFDGYEINDLGVRADNLKTFNDFNTADRPLFSKGDIIKVYDSTNTNFLGQFTLQNHKSRFQYIGFEKNDIFSEIGDLPKEDLNTNYRIRLIKTDKEQGGEKIRYRTSAYPKSLGFQSPEILPTTKLIDLNGLDITKRCSRFNPDGSDFQETPGCGWGPSELSADFALGTFWYQNGASTTRVDLNISRGDNESTIQTLMDIVQRSGGNVKLDISGENNSLVIVDQITEEIVPVLKVYIDVAGTGCVKSDNTADRLGLTEYGGKNLNPLGVGQIKQIFQDRLEFIGGLTNDPFNGGDNVNTFGFPFGYELDVSGNFTSASRVINSFEDHPINPFGSNAYGGTIRNTDFSFAPSTPVHYTTAGKNPAFDLLYVFYSLTARINQSDIQSSAVSPGPTKIARTQVNANGEIIIESDFSSSPDNTINGSGREGTRFKGTWSFQYPADNRVFGKTRNTAPVPDIEASLTWGIGQLNIDIVEEGEGYSTGRFDTSGNPTNSKDIRVSFTNMPLFNSSGSDPNYQASWDPTGVNNGTYTFSHNGSLDNNGKKNFLFNPQSVLKEIGITTQAQINNIGIIESGISTDITEPIKTEINLTNRRPDGSCGSVPSGSDSIDSCDEAANRYRSVFDNFAGKYAVLRPSDTLATLNHFVRLATAKTIAGVGGPDKYDLSISTHGLVLDNDNQSVILKEIFTLEGNTLDIPKIPYITDIGFFYTTDAASQYSNKKMTLDFSKDLKIKYNREKHQPIGDNIILSTATGLDIGQSVENFSLLPIPPVNDDDFLDLNAAEESLQSLYGTSTIGDFSGRGKVFITRESYLTKPAGFYRTVSFEDKGSPFYEQVRAEDAYGSFDTKTMPILFDFVTSENTWRFFEAPFKDRLTGTLSTNPGPTAFIGTNNTRTRKTINDLTFWRDRLWMCTEDNVYSSKVGDYFNLWLDNPDNIVDTDPIDVRTGRGDLVTINHLVPFESYMFVSTFNDIQFELLGSENQITPLTAELQATAFYSTDPISTPQILGSQIYFFAPKKIYLYYGSGAGSVNNAAEVTFQAEDYLPAKFQSIASSAIKNMISLVDADNQNIIYFYTSRFSGDKIIQNSLHKWTLSTTDKIKSTHFIDNDLYTVVLRPFKRPNKETSSQFFLQKCSVKTEAETYPRIDRRVSMEIYENLRKVKSVDKYWGSITSVTFAENSTRGFNLGDTLTFESKYISGADGGEVNINPGSGLVLSVTGVDSSGRITAVAIKDGGSGYVLPTSVGMPSNDTDGNLQADIKSNNFPENTKSTTTNILSGPPDLESPVPDVDPTGGASNPLRLSQGSGKFAVRPSNVNNLTPFGYRANDVIYQSSTSGSGTGLSVKILTVSEVNQGHPYFNLTGLITSWAVEDAGKEYVKSETVTMQAPVASTKNPTFVVQTLVTNTNLNTTYTSSSDTTEFILPVHNDEANQAIVGKNQTDIGELLAIDSVVSSAGKKTVFTVKGDQRASNITSNEDYGEVTGTTSLFDDYGRNTDVFLQEKLEFGRLFNFFDFETDKTENWFGTSFTMTATLSEIVFRDQTNNTLDGVLSLKNVSIKYYKTGKFNLQVKRKPYNNNTDLVITDPFYKERINAESFDSSQLSVAENGEFMAKVLSFSPNAEISFISDYHQPVNIANIEFRGLFSPRMSSIRN